MVKMKINFKIHNRNHIIKSIFGNIESLFTGLGLKKGKLTVVNYHGTQKIFIENFEKQLNYFQKIFYIISPKQLDDFYKGNLNNINKPLLLITFDDGIKNNLHALKVLYNKNINAFLFIVPNFIESPLNEQKTFFKKNIRPEINQYIDKKDEDFTSLNWDDLKKAESEGNVIGSHTLSHTIIASASSNENSEYEIRKSREIICNNLSVSPEKINAFCSINDTTISVSKKELTIIKEEYIFHFTTLPGQNTNKSDSYFIKRINIEAHWLLGAVKFAIGKWNLILWKTKISNYQKINHGL